MPESSAHKPLCVDLDGTLIKTDTLVELFFRALKASPLTVFLMPFWLIKGIAYLKIRLSERFADRLNTVPFSMQFLGYLKAEKAAGRKIYLATACEEGLARKLVEKLGVFDDVFGTRAKLNLKSSRKAALLVEKFGAGGFDYAGNSRQDLAVWSKADGIIAVNAPAALKRTIARDFPGKPVQCFDNQAMIRPVARIKAWLKLIRVHQWSKNLLLFVPLVTAHKYVEEPALVSSVLAFAFFSLCASSIYIFNDLVDLESDRNHESKKYRALAAGNIQLRTAFFLGGGMLITAFVGAFVCLPGRFFLGMGLYAVITTLYSFFLKKMMLMDVVILAILYTMRIIIGGEAIAVEISFWLLTFSLFIFLSLAFLKRFVELKYKAPASNKVSGRGYLPEDLPMVQTMGIASGFISVLLYVVYIDRAAMEHYHNPNALISGCVVLLYFICRIWMRANRGFVSSDPIVAAIKDKGNYVLALVFVLLFLLARPI